MVHHISNLHISYKEPLTLFLFGDLQIGAGGFSKEAWQEFRIQFKRCPNAHSIGLGDYGDWLRPSMRARLLQPLAHDDSARQQLDNMVLKDQDKLIDELSFMGGRILGLHSGHHEWEFATGINSSQRIASGLKAPYLGWIASHRLILRKDKNMKSLSYTMISTHGNSNSRSVPASLNWMTNNLVSGFIADHYIMGHGCKGGAIVPYERNIIRRNGPPGAITQLPRVLMVGGFSKGYTDGWHTSYVEKNGFTPQPIGWGKITIKITQARSHDAAKGVATRTNSLDISQENCGPAADSELYV